MFSKIKRAEDIIIKLIIIQLICMIIAQLIIQNEELSVHFNKSIYYEGVVNGSHSETVETLDQ
jgi:hypothetical protein